MNINKTIQDGTATFKVYADGLKAYPIGSIYLSAIATPPSQLFGGDWIELPAGRVLLAQGTADSGTVYTAGSKGGEESHTLTTNEIPNHGLHTYDSPYGVGSYNGYFNIDKMTAYGSGGRGWDVKSSNEIHPAGHYVGGNASHNNMQPYLAVYMWQRVG